MDQLKEAVSSAAPGTGEVQQVIRESTFQPRAAAFTSLIQQCARARAWQKAVDVFHALQETPGLKVKTAPLRAFQANGRDSLTCKASLLQSQEARHSLLCRQAACVRRTVVRIVHHSGLDQLAGGMSLMSCSCLLTVSLCTQPNFINYSALISACSASGRWQEAEKTFSDMLAASESDEECRWDCSLSFIPCNP